MKKIVKRIGLLLLCIAGAIVLVLAVLLIKNYLDSQKPWLADDYYTEFQAGASLEKKYAGLGNFQVSDQERRMTLALRIRPRSLAAWLPFPP